MSLKKGSFFKFGKGYGVIINDYEKAAILTDGGATMDVIDTLPPNTQKIELSQVRGNAHRVALQFGAKIVNNS